MLRRTLTRVKHLPRNPIRLARALIAPVPVISGPRFAADLPAWTGGYPLFLVHGDPRQGHVVMVRLKEEGWRVIVCLTADMALMLMKDVPASLIITQRPPPDMTTGAFRTELANRPDVQHAPVVLLTAATEMPQNPDRLRHTPPTMYVSDADRIDRLIDVVRELLLTRGNWRTPPGYTPERAARALEEEELLDH